MGLQRTEQEIFNSVELKINLSITIFFSLHLNEFLSRLEVTDHKISFSIESLLIVEENKVSNSWDFGLEPVENFFPLTEISKVSKMNSKRFSTWIKVELFQIGCDSLKLNNICTILLVLIIIFWTPELFLVLILIIGAVRSRAVITVGIIRWRVFWVSFAIIIVAVFIEPPAIFVILEDVVASGDGET